MTSQKSFKNNFGFAYRTGLKSNIAVALIQFFIGTLAFVYVPAKVLFKKVAADSASGKIESYNVKNDYSFYLTDNMQYLRYLLIAAFLILGIIMGIMTFKFMTGKKTMNVYYSLGIKRTHLFTAKYLSGLTLMAVAIFLHFFISWVYFLCQPFHIRLRRWFSAQSEQFLRAWCFPVL